LHLTLETFTIVEPDAIGLCQKYRRKRFLIVIRYLLSCVFEKITFATGLSRFQIKYRL